MNPSSYENVKSKWIPELRHHAPFGVLFPKHFFNFSNHHQLLIRNVPIILCGTKVDLREDMEVRKSLAEKGQEPISFNLGRALSDAIGAICYTETSAKTQKGLKETFDLVIEAVVDQTKREKIHSTQMMKGKKEKCLLQ